MIVDPYYVYTSVAYRWCIIVHESQAIMALTLPILFTCVCSLSIAVAVDNDHRREELVKSYFYAGYTYNLILCFLAGVHGIIVSLRTLKRVLRRLNLRRRGTGANSINLRIAARCMMVSKLQ